MSGSSTFHILFYEYVEDVTEKRAPHREAHLTRIKEEQAAGRITEAGALGDPPHSAAIVFQGVDRRHIEQFAEGDPYVQAGLVTVQRIEPWKLV